MHSHPFPAGRRPCSFQRGLTLAAGILAMWLAAAGARADVTLTSLYSFGSVQDEFGTPLDGAIRMPVWCKLRMVIFTARPIWEARTTMARCSKWAPTAR